MAEYDWNYLEVRELGVGIDDEVESPEWADVKRALRELADGSVDGSVSLRLEVDAELPPTLIAGVVGKELALSFSYDDGQLYPAQETHSLDEALRIFHLFYAEQRLDPDDDWEPA